MELIARSRAAFFKLCGKHAPLSFPRARQGFQRNSPAKTQAAAPLGSPASWAAISKHLFSLKHFNFARGI